MGRLAQALGLEPMPEEQAYNNALAYAVNGQALADEPAELAPGTVMLETPRPLNLVNSDLEAVNVVAASARGTVARYRVPRGQIIELLLETPMRLYLRSMASFNVTSTAGGAATLNFMPTPARLVRSLRPAPGLPVTVGHPDLTVWGGTPYVVRQITGINWDAQTVDVGGLPVSAAITLDAYYLAGAGDVRIRASLPSGLDTTTVELYNNPLRALHETDQAGGRTAPRLSRPGLETLPLGPGWLLELDIEGAAMNWHVDARHELRIPAQRYAVDCADVPALNAAIVRMLRE